MQSSEKRKKMNIYDIAKEAGVSISTVSRVMNNKGNVNAATRKKVEAILDKHDYTPSAIARGMVSKTSTDCGYPRAALCENCLYN